MIDSYQQEIIPGFRDRAEKAEKEAELGRLAVEAMDNDTEGSSDEDNLSCNIFCQRKGVSGWCNSCKWQKFCRQRAEMEAGQA
jgi:predicted transcriptional regulator